MISRPSPPDSASSHTNNHQTMTPRLASTNRQQTTTAPAGYPRRQRSAVVRTRPETNPTKPHNNTNNTGAPGSLAMRAVAAPRWLGLAAGGWWAVVPKEVWRSLLCEVRAGAGPRHHRARQRVVAAVRDGRAARPFTPERDDGRRRRQRHGGRRRQPPATTADRRVLLFAVAAASAHGQHSELDVALRSLLGEPRGCCCCSCFAEGEHPKPTSNGASR